MRWRLRWGRFGVKDECRAERALGAAEFFPGASRQVRGVGKRGREGNVRAAQGTTRVERRTTIHPGLPWHHSPRGGVGKSHCVRPARGSRGKAGGGSRGASWGGKTSAELNVRWGRHNFSLGPAGRCEGEEAADGRKCEGGAG